MVYLFTYWLLHTEFILHKYNKYSLFSLNTKQQTTWFGQHNLINYCTLCLYTTKHMKEGGRTMTPCNYAISNAFGRLECPPLAPLTFFHHKTRLTTSVGLRRRILAPSFYYKDDIQKLWRLHLKWSLPVGTLFLGTFVK